MKSKKLSIAGWILSGLIAAMLLGPSAGGKFAEWEGKEKAFADMGFTTDLMFNIGILEVMLTILFLIPRTAFIGAILLTGYLGGATVVHLRVGQPFVFPVVLGALMWIGCALRNPLIFRLAFGVQGPYQPTSEENVAN